MRKTKLSKKMLFLRIFIQDYSPERKENTNYSIRLQSKKRNKLEPCRPKANITYQAIT